MKSRFGVIKQVWIFDVAGIKLITSIREWEKTSRLWQLVSNMFAHSVFVQLVAWIEMSFNVFETRWLSLKLFDSLSCPLANIFVINKIWIYSFFYLFAISWLHQLYSNNVSWNRCCLREIDFITAFRESNLVFIISIGNEMTSHNLHQNKVEISFKQQLPFLIYE